MPVLPKSLLVLGASIQSARTARRLRRPATAAPEQWQSYRYLVDQLALTDGGRSVEIENRMDYARFRSRVPVRTHEQFASQIDRMKRGGSNVLWPGQCSLYATTAGTTGHPKLLPVTLAMAEHFRRALLTSLFCYTARAGRTGVFRRAHLSVGGPTTIKPMAGSKPAVARSGNLTGIRIASMPAWLTHAATAFTDSPDEEGEQDALASDAAIPRDRVALISGMPDSVLNFANALRERSIASRQPLPTLSALWPELECLQHCGVPIAPFQDELRQALGSSVRFHEVYCAAEGVIAAQDGEPTAGLRLITDAGLFFEFIPLRDYMDSGRLSLGEKAIPLDQVRAGVDYVLLLTTPAGLCRYVLGDIVRFISTEPPRLVYVGRTELQLNAYGERVIEKELTDALVTVCNRHRWTIKNFHVAPIIMNSLTGQSWGRHEWWVELRPGTIETPTGPILAAELDRDLCARNPDYQAKRNNGSLDAPFVRLVMPGLFRHWMRTKEKWGPEYKMPRCRSDRLIADELMAIACFTD